MPTVVRPFRAEDAPAVVALALEMAEDLDDPQPSLGGEELVQLALGPDAWCSLLVAETGGALGGFALLCRRYEAHRGRRSLWIADLHVARIARRRGVGRALMAAVGRRALAEGCALVAWNLWELNAAGRALYRSVGAHQERDIEAWEAPAAALAALEG